MGYAEILKRKLFLSESMDEMLRASVERIEYLSETMHQIIIDFLDFQAMDDGQLGPGRHPWLGNPRNQ